MRVEEGLESVRAENAALRQQLMALVEQLTATRDQLAAVQEQLRVAEERIAEWEAKKEGPPSFVKANKRRAEGPKRPRRKRKAEENGARRRETPTRVVQHALESCPDCGYELEGTSIGRRRQVIELPSPPRVEVIEHQVIKRRCPHCGRWKMPKLNLQGQVLGQGRIGVRLASLIAYLRTSLRQPFRAIQEYLETIHEVWLSVGELVELLDQMRREVRPGVEDLAVQMRGSAVVHVDETGWREDGRNGYVWTFSTPGPQAVRYYHYQHSRGQRVVRGLLCEFAGVLSSDFLGSYNVYRGKHQRCWTHLLRALHELKEEHAGDAVVVGWAQEVRALYDEAQAFLAGPAPPSREMREQRYAQLVQEVERLGLAYAQVKKHPCQALAKRLLRHQDELFQFVLVEGLSANNNLAERSLRPLVVARKISGGTRSSDGSATRMALATLLGTWQARHLNPFNECFRLLSQTSLLQI
jgi:transposase